MLVTTKILIDLQRRSYPQVVNAVQGDQNSRGLEICLFSSGAAWTIPEGVTAAMRYCKPDKTKGYYDTMPDGTPAWSVKDNVVTMLLAPQMLTVTGTVLAQMEMILGSSVLATFTMQIDVAENPAAGVLVSEDYVNWLQWMETELDSRINEMLEAGEFIGPQGPAGESVTVLSHAVDFQASSSYEEIPEGEWSADVPAVAQGGYLWTRTTVEYNSGDPVVTYSVARFGKDGTGAAGAASSVNTVCGVAPDADGNIPLNAKDVKAVPLTGGTMTGPLHMNGQTLSGLNAPTADDEAATKGYADRYANASNISTGTMGADRLPTVPIAKGGTGATNAADARTKLGITPENIGALSMELLWENASPDSEFAAQRIALEQLGQYSAIAVEHKGGIFWTSTQGTTRTISSVNAYVNDAYYIYLYSRAFTSGNNYLEFYDAFNISIKKTGETSWNVHNTLFIPLKIYGVKGVSA